MGMWDKYDTNRIMNRNTLVYKEYLRHSHKALQVEVEVLFCLSCFVFSYEPNRNASSNSVLDFLILLNTIYMYTVHFKL